MATTLPLSTHANECSGDIETQNEDQTNHENPTVDDYCARYKSAQLNKDLEQKKN